MTKRVTVQSELTTEELHERYRNTTNAVERTRLPYSVANEGGPHARGECSHARLSRQVGSHAGPALESN